VVPSPKSFPTPQPFPHLPETRKNHNKKPAFTVSRKIPDSKELTFENRYKNYIFLSVFFGINLYT
jgi:hypothetical protein